VLGLKKKTTAPAPIAVTPITTPAKSPINGGPAIFIFGGTACGSERMTYWN
jgi:hypothetical protein